MSTQNKITLRKIDFSYAMALWAKTKTKTQSKMTESSLGGVVLVN